MRAADVEYLVVHTAAFPHRNCDRDLIDRWHRERGWNGIGYHYVIINDRHDHLEDGTVQVGRPADRQGAHVKGINSRSIGICCVGHGDRDPHTEAQRTALIQLLSELMETHPRVTVDGVIGHREVNDLVARGVVSTQYRTSKTCPGTKVDMDEIREELRAFRAGVPEERDDREEVDPEELRAALELLTEVPASMFPNASEELRAFLGHPEVRSLREERDGD